jgi:hypothetical protein
VSSSLFPQPRDRQIQRASRASRALRGALSLSLAAWPLLLVLNIPLLTFALDDPTAGRAPIVSKARLVLALDAAFVLVAALAGACVCAFTAWEGRFPRGLGRRRNTFLVLWTSGCLVGSLFVLFVWLYRSAG